MFKYGFELEYFLVDNNQEPVLVPKGVPKDDCGFLVEARSKPYYSIHEAMGSLWAEISRIKNLLHSFDGAQNYFLTLDKTSSFRKLPKELLRLARRANSKGPIRYRNLYGFKEPYIGNVQTAGLHISITNVRTIYPDKSNIGHDVNAFWDYVPLFKALDKKFTKEIKEARRRPGFYEVKEDGRIEYRSLPNTIGLECVSNFIHDFMNGIEEVYAGED